MSTILSFGCSHSLGYYNMDNSPSNEKTWPELLFNNSKNVNFHAHFALPGHGVVDYCFLLMKLEENGTLNNNNVSKIVIQHTSEPRCVFYTESKMMEKFFNHRVMTYFSTMVHGSLEVLNIKDFNLETFKVRPINLTSTSFAASVGDGVFDSDKPVDTETRLELVEQFDKMSWHFMNSPTALNIIQLSYEKIHQIAEKYNIELYEFRWPGMSSSFNNVPIIGSDIKDYGSITNGNGHVVEEHIDKLNSEILELMTNNGFFK